MIYGYQEYLNKNSGYTAEARIRVNYNPTLINILEEETTRIIMANQYKGIYADSLSYVTIGSIDNIKLENKVIEFKVKKSTLRG